MSLDDCSQFVAVTFQWPATALLNFKVLISVAKLLESPLHCMLLSSSWAKCVVDVAQKSPDTPGSPEGNTEGPGTASSEPLLPS